jgi:hypothetical protein
MTSVATIGAQEFKVKTFLIKGFFSPVSVNQIMNKLFIIRSIHVQKVHRPCIVTIFAI